jgi:hypothetical protein
VLSQGRWKGGTTLPRRTQMKGKHSSSAASWKLELCLGKEKAGTFKVFKNNFNN